MVRERMKAIECILFIASVENRCLYTYIECARCPKILVSLAYSNVAFCCIVHIHDFLSPAPCKIVLNSKHTHTEMYTFAIHNNRKMYIK